MVGIIFEPAIVATNRAKPDDLPIRTYELARIIGQRVSNPFCVFRAAIGG